MKYLANPSPRNVNVAFTGLYDSPEFNYHSRRNNHITEHPYIATPTYNRDNKFLTYSTKYPMSRHVSTKASWLDILTRRI